VAQERFRLWPIGDRAAGASTTQPRRAVALTQGRRRVTGPVTIQCSGAGHRGKDPQTLMARTLQGPLRVAAGAWPLAYLQQAAPEVLASLFLNGDKNDGTKLLRR